MSTSVLPQLLEVDSELSAQASTLEAQLKQLQEKRKGIRTVIAMFESGRAPATADIPAIVESAPAEESAAEPVEEPTEEPAVEPVASQTTKTKAVNKRKTKATAAKTTAKTTKAKANKAKAKRGRPANAKAAVSADSSEAKSEAKPDAKATAKQSGRSSNWHRYVQETYRQAPLPDVVVGVLQAQPGNVFKIADVMSAVFKEDMPENYFLKARNRVSNILSAGARSGEWYRGRGGTYSVSEKAIARVG